MPPGAITLSHTDKVVDRGYHREILGTGVFVEYDQAFRWPADTENGTLTLLGWMLEDGFDDRLMLGLDAARQGYWSAYGGTPGMAYLLGDFSQRMDAAGHHGAEHDGGCSSRIRLAPSPSRRTARVAPFPTRITIPET